MIPREWADFWAAVVVMALAIWLGLAFFMAEPLHADDSAFVHDLAHGAGGVLVASALNVTLHKQAPAWEATIIELTAALAVDWAYEAATNKDAATTWRHNGDAVLGAGLIAFQVEYGRSWQ